MISRANDILFGGTVQFLGHGWDPQRGINHSNSRQHFAELPEVCSRPACKVGQEAGGAWRLFRWYIDSAWTKTSFARLCLVHRLVQGLMILWKLQIAFQRVFFVVFFGGFGFRQNFLNYVLIDHRTSWSARGFSLCQSNSKYHCHGYQSNSFSGSSRKLEKTCFTSSNSVSWSRLRHCSNIMLTKAVSGHFLKLFSTRLVENASKVAFKACTRWSSTDDFAQWTYTLLRICTRAPFVAHLGVFAALAALLQTLESWKQTSPNHSQTRPGRGFSIFFSRRDCWCWL